MWRIPRAILWDLDGTLVDSATAIVDSLRHALDCLGHRSVSFKPSTVVGPPLGVSLGALGLSPNETTAVREVYLERFVKCGIRKVTPFVGALELVADIGKHGVSQGIVTNRLQHVARRVTAAVGLDGFVDAICGRERSTEHKRDVLGRALVQLGLEPGPRIVMIGDRYDDIAVGRSFGLTTVGVGWGYAAPNELDDGEAITVSTMHDLRRLLLECA